MRAVIDITDDATDEAFALPDPGLLSMEGDEVVMALRELELRMTFPQFISLQEAFSHWLFRDCTGEKDLNDKDHLPGEEHERLRKIFREIDGGQVRGVDVPKDLRWAIKARLSALKVDPDEWQGQQEELRIAEAKVLDLTEELRIAKQRRKKKEAEP